MKARKKKVATPVPTPKSAVYTELLNKLIIKFSPVATTPHKTKRNQLLVGIMEKLADEIERSWAQLSNDANKTLIAAVNQQRTHYAHLMCPLCDQGVPHVEYNGRYVHYVTTKEAAANPHPNEDSITRIRCGSSAIWGSE